MYEICLAIYNRFGQDGVIKFCDAIGWDEWLVCEPCEIESPVENGICLVCGTEVI